jgi:hypothetical protein
MTLRTGKSGRYRHYTCCTKARQGATGCPGRTVPMEKLDNLVAEYIEQRLLQPRCLEQLFVARTRSPQARLDAERAQDAIERGGPTITSEALKTFARTARKRMRTDGGGYRRDHLRALVQRVEVDQSASWDRKACSCVRSSPLKAQKRRVLECPVLYRSGAPEEIRTPRFVVWFETLISLWAL